MDTNFLLSEYFKSKTYEDLLNLSPESDPTEVKDIIGCIERMMKKCARNITYTQLRNILQVVKKEDYKTNLSSFYMVIPRLAYMQARPQKEKEGKDIIAFIREMAGAVQNEKQYQGFEEVMNTIVAYHKLYG